MPSKRKRGSRNQRQLAKQKSETKKRQIATAKLLAEQLGYTYKEALALLQTLPAPKSRSTFYFCIFMV